MDERDSHSGATDTQQSSSSKQYDEYLSDNQSEWQNRKISLKNLQPFCEQLHEFLKYVRSIQQLTYLTYDCPSIFQSCLEKDANELESLYMEVKDAVINIDRLKNQKKIVKKEKSCVKKALNKLHEEEIQHMENIISTYDKTMFTRWENIKNTHKPEVLEILLNDVKGKQQALENLNTLISRRLGQLQIFVPLLTSAENAAAAVLATSPTPTSSLAPCKAGRTNHNTDNQNLNTAPKRNHGMSSNISRSESRRRRRRNQENQNTRTTQQENGHSDLPVLPFTIGPNPFQILGTNISLPVNITTSTTTNAYSNSHHELVTVGSSINALRNNESNNSTSNTNIRSEFQTEMRHVIQALFGELRRSPPTTSSLSNSQRENDNRIREIELYAIRTPPPSND